MLFVPDDVVGRCMARFRERETPDVVAGLFNAVEYGSRPMRSRCSDLEILVGVCG